MKRIYLYFLIIPGFLCTEKLYPQDFPVHELNSYESSETISPVPLNPGADLKPRGNYIHVNFGWIEVFSINYERNIIRWPAASTNLRLGFGEGNDLQGGYSEVIVALVHLYGKRNSHAEINAGLAYTKNLKENLNPSATSSMVYFYTGYRFEKPYGRFIFRTGVMYFNLLSLSVGVGVKF